MIELIGLQIKSFRSTCNKTLNDQLKNEKNETFLLVNFSVLFISRKVAPKLVLLLINIRGNLKSLVSVLHIYDFS